MEADEEVAGRSRAVAPVFTIATLVEHAEHYAELQASFSAFGFDEADCEFLAVDNTGEAKTSPYLAYNSLLAEAQGDLVILCHEQVRLVDDGRPQLEACIGELEALDRNWAVCGNVGAVAPGRHSVRMTDPSGSDQRIGEFPARVTSLDERFMVVRRSARVGFSHDIDGAEFCGTDICLLAELAGLTCYAIDFHVECMAQPRPEESLREDEKRFRDKWMRAMRSRYVQTPRRLLQIGAQTVLGINGRVKDAQPALIGRIAVGRR